MQSCMTLDDSLPGFGPLAIRVPRVEAPPLISPTEGGAFPRRLPGFPGRPIRRPVSPTRPVRRSNAGGILSTGCQASWR